MTCYHCLKSPHDVDCPTGGVYAKLDVRASTDASAGVAWRHRLFVQGRNAGKTAQTEADWAALPPPRFRSPIAFDIMKEAIDKEIARTRRFTLRYVPGNEKLTITNTQAEPVYLSMSGLVDKETADELSHKGDAVVKIAEDQRWAWDEQLAWPDLFGEPK